MKAILVIAMSFVSFSASADYFKAGLGYSLGGETKFEGAGSNTTTDFKNTFLAPLLLAYGFEIMGDVHGELEFAYRKNEYDVPGDLEPEALTGAFNIVANAPLGNVTLTGGAGLLFGSFDPGSSAFDSGTAFGLQLFGGLDFPINNTVSIGGELRYMTTITKFDAGSFAGNDIKGSYNNTSFIINAKFSM